MLVCKHCLMAIESHEGYQRSRKITSEDVSPDLIREDGYEELIRCEWCDEEYPIDEMNEI